MAPPNNFSDLVYQMLGVLGVAVPVLTSLAFLIFLWGLVKFIFRIGGDETAVKDGKKLMLWGIIALFILVSLNAIINFTHNEFFDRPYAYPMLPPQ